MNPRALLVAVLLTGALAPAALARNEKGDWEFGAHLGPARWVDSNLENDPFWGVNAGYSFTDFFEIALNFDSLDTDPEDDPGDAELDFLTFDFILNLGEDAHRPFALIGIGRLGRDIRRSILPGVSVRDKDTAELIDLGFGYRGYFGRLFGLRLDGRLSFTDDDGDGFSFEERDLRFSLGLVVSAHP